MSDGRRSSATLRLTAAIILGMLLSTVGGALFVYIADDVASDAALTMFDAGLSQVFYARATPASTSMYMLVTWFGGPGIVVTALVVGGVLIARRHWMSLAVWAVGLAGGGLLNVALKAYFARPRPVFDVPLLVERSFSFPSAHAMTSFITYGLLMYLLWREVESRIARILIAFVTVLLVMFIGVSRMALGVHYFSDVIAGYGAGALWLGVCIIAFNVLERRTPPTEGKKTAL